jgi:hypothetical protein
MVLAGDLPAAAVIRHDKLTVNRRRGDDMPATWTSSVCTGKHDEDHKEASRRFWPSQATFQGR